MNVRHNAPGGQPGNDQIQREAAYMAAVEGWYDTSERRRTLLRVSITDLVKIGESTLPEGATHRFFVVVNDTSCIVTRYAGGHYEVQPYNQVEPQRQERALRAAVMDAALQHFIGFSPDPDAQEEERAAAIQAMLESVDPNPERDGGPVVHAVVREELPDIFLGGDEARSAQRVRRQWTVLIGSNRCEVGLISYAPDGTPKLIAREANPETEDGTEGDEAGGSLALTDRIAVIKSLFPDSEGEDLVKRLNDLQAILKDQENDEERQRALEAFLTRKKEELENHEGA